MFLTTFKFIKLCDLNLSGGGQLKFNIKTKHDTVSSTLDRSFCLLKSPLPTLRYRFLQIYLR